jgi:hypothetical protein
LTATLKLTREGTGIELRRGAFTVYLDDTPAGSIERHQTLELPIEPGRHTLRLGKSRYSSHDESFETSDGEVVNFRCHGAMLWPRYVASLLIPRLAISLRRE